MEVLTTLQNWRALKCTTLEKHQLTNLLYLNPRLRLTWEFQNLQFHFITAVFLSASPCKYAWWFCFGTWSVSKGLALWLGTSVTSIFCSESQILQPVERLCFSGAVHSVSLVINIDVFVVRRGRRQVPFQKHFFGQDPVLQQCTHDCAMPCLVWSHPQQLQAVSHFPLQPHDLANVGLPGTWQAETTFGTALEPRDLGCFHFKV